jgi:GT2 family glycosyltransferase
VRSRLEQGEVVPASGFSPGSVTVMIATKDRPDDLQRTLRVLRGLTYKPIQLLVIDDGSSVDLRQVVEEGFPGAEFHRRDTSAGQSLRRSEAFDLISGEFILQLDDDSAPIGSDAIQRAVQIMESRPRIGALSFRIFNGPAMPGALPLAERRYVTSFVGCGVLFRRRALHQTGGYQSFFGSEWEEEELGIRLLKAGWLIYFTPELVIHHHLSPLNRKTPTTWMRGFRNRLWAHVMHYRMDRLILESTWVLGVAVWDAIRLWRPHYLLLGLLQFATNLPKVIRLRSPMSKQVTNLYEALRFRGIKDDVGLENPGPIKMADIAAWYRRWRDRPRQRSMWDRRSGDIGACATVEFAHQHPEDKGPQ